MLIQGTHCKRTDYWVERSNGTPVSSSIEYGSSDESNIGSPFRPNAMAPEVSEANDEKSGSGVLSIAF